VQAWEPGCAIVCCNPIRSSWRGGGGRRGQQGLHSRSGPASGHGVAGDWHQSGLLGAYAHRCRACPVADYPYLRVLLGKGNDPADFISAVLVETTSARQEAVAAAIERVGDVRVIKASDVLGNIKQQLESLFFIMLGGGLLAALAAIVQIFARFSSLPGIARASGACTARWARPGDLKRSSWARPRF